MQLPGAALESRTSSARRRRLDHTHNNDFSMSTSTPRLTTTSTKSVVTQRTDASSVYCTYCTPRCNMVAEGQLLTHSSSLNNVSLSFQQQTTAFAFMYPFLFKLGRTLTSTLPQSYTRQWRRAIKSKHELNTSDPLMELSARSCTSKIPLVHLRTCSILCAALVSLREHLPIG